MKTRIATLVTVLLLALVLVAVAQDDSVTVKTEVMGSDSTLTAETPHNSGTLVVTYFHGDVRCATCKKLEAYSHEAITTGFANELDKGDIVWRTVNYDEEGFKHYIEDYGLYTKALILSMVKDTVEVRWKNLEKIWNLVGDKDEFIKYVQTETRDFLKQDSE